MEKTDLTRKEAGKWDCKNKNNFSVECGDHSCELTSSWPPKYYCCSFCKREFKSAQALGGHMNVHRRERARLRLLPSWVLEYRYNPNKPNPNFNPNPNSSPPTPSSLAAAKFSPNPGSQSLLVSSSSTRPWCGEKRRKKPLIPQLVGDLTKENAISPIPGLAKLQNHAQRSELDQVAGRVTGSDLEKAFKDPEEILDLELRLGCF